MFAYDADNDKFWMGFNGSWNKETDAGRDPDNGVDPDFEPSASYKPYVPWFHPAATTQENQAVFNFGQGDKDGFNNFTDSNGRGGFRYKPPQGFLSCCTANMKDADYAPLGPNTAAGTPDKHFDTVLYSGADMTASNDPDASSRIIGGLNFQPDLVLIKNRSTTDGWSLQDSVRGWEYGTKLSTYDTSDENKSDGGSYGNYGFVSGAFDGGFEICPGTSPGQVDGPTSEEFAAWCWKAGNDTTSVTTNLTNCSDVTQSVNVDAGFAITRYKSTTSASVVFPHNLGKTPEWIIVKNRDDTNAWMVWHTGLTAGNNNLRLNTTDDMASSGSGYINAPTSTLINLEAGGGNVAGSGTNYICYAWAGIEGYSSFGTYRGNASTDGPFIYTGFRPRLVITKHFSGTSTEQWQVVDTARNTENPCELRHFMNSTAAENTDGTNHRMDILSNGFKIRGAHVLSNGSTEGYIYMAFAEMPFKYANAR